MTAPTLRAALDRIPIYVPGQPAASDAMKLSSNENPYPPLPSVIDEIAAELSHLNRYPDAGCSRLYAALAHRFDLPETRFAAGNGSVAVLFSLMQTLCSEGDEVIYAWRSFEAYPIAVELTGATSVRVPLAEGATHDLAAMLDAITSRTKVIVVCTPNNPTGPVVEADALGEFIDRVPPHVLVVVDEAYAEFVRDPAAGHGLDFARPNVVVLRTFSKAYGLAGLRVGFAIADPPVATAIRKATAPFSVTDVAQAAAVASLAAESELSARVDAIVAERERVHSELSARGWSVPASQANFVWLPLGSESVPFAGHCAEAGLSLRPFDGDGVRVSIGAPEINNVFLAAVERWGQRPIAR